jgi:hypothetical protein
MMLCICIAHQSSGSLTRGPTNDVCTARKRWSKWFYSSSSCFVCSRCGAPAKCSMARRMWMWIRM